MKKLTKTLIIGGSTVATVGGGAAGAAVAFSNKKGTEAKADANAQVDKSIISSNVAKQPGQDELKAVEYAAKHELLTKNQGLPRSAETISATSVATDTPHANEFFAHSTKEQKDHAKAEALKFQLEAAAHKAEWLESQLAEAKRVASLPEGTKDAKAQEKLVELQEMAKNNADKAAALEHELARAMADAHLTLQMQAQKEAQEKQEKELADAFRHAVEDPNNAQHEVILNKPIVIESSITQDVQDLINGKIAVPEHPETIIHSSEEFFVDAPVAKLIPIDEHKEVSPAVVTFDVSIDSSEINNLIPAEDFLNLQNERQALIQEALEKQMEEANQRQSDLISAQLQIDQIDKSGNMRMTAHANEAAEQAALMEAGAKAFAADKTATEEMRVKELAEASTLQTMFDAAQTRLSDVIDHLNSQEEAKQVNAQTLAKEAQNQLETLNKQMALAQQARLSAQQANAEKIAEAQRQAAQMEAGSKAFAAEQGDINARRVAELNAANTQQKLFDDAQARLASAIAHLDSQEAIDQAAAQDQIKEAQSHLDALNKQMALAQQARLSAQQANAEKIAEAQRQAAQMEAGSKAFATEQGDINARRVAELNAANTQQKLFDDAQARLASAIAHLDSQEAIDQAAAQDQIKDAQSHLDALNKQMALAQQARLSAQQANAEKIAKATAERIEQQAAETAKNYALIESEIDARLHQRQMEEAMLNHNAELAAEKAAQELYETQKHGSEVNALEIAHRVMLEEKADLAGARADAAMHLAETQRQGALVSAQRNAQRNSQLANKEVAQEIKGVLDEQQRMIDADIALANFENSKTTTKTPEFDVKTSGQAEYEASQVAHSQRVEADRLQAEREFAEMGAKAAQAAVQSVNKQGNVQSTSNFLDEESKAAQAAFDNAKENENKKDTFVGETSGQAEYEASQVAHSQRVEADRLQAEREFAEMGAKAAQAAVQSVNKQGNVQSTSNFLDEESKAAQAAFDNAKEILEAPEFVSKASGQAEYDASQVAHSQRVEADRVAELQARHQQEVNVAQEQLRTQASRQGSVELTQHQIDALKEWKLVTRADASQYLPSNLVNEIFSTGAEKAYISAAKNDETAALWVLLNKYDMFANTAGSYVEMNVKVKVELAPNAHAHRNPAHLGHFETNNPGLGIWDMNTQKAITITGDLPRGQFDLFNPPANVVVSDALIKVLEDHGARTAMVELTNPTNESGSTFGTSATFIINGVKAIERGYFQVSIINGQQHDVNHEATRIKELAQSGHWTISASNPNNRLRTSFHGISSLAQHGVTMPQGAFDEAHFTYNVFSNWYGDHRCVLTVIVMSKDTSVVANQFNIELQVVR